MLKSIKKIKFLLIVIIGLLGFYGFKNYAKTVKDKHCLTTQISSKIFDFNTFKIINKSNIDIMELKVVNRNSGKVIFENGKRKKRIKNEYGHCLFYLYQNGILKFEFGHFKTNNWYTNDYILTIEQTNGILNPTLDISGENVFDGDLFYKKFEYNNGKLKQISYISKEKEVYNIEIPPEAKLED